MTDAPSIFAGHACQKPRPHSRAVFDGRRRRTYQFGAILRDKVRSQRSVVSSKLGTLSISSTRKTPLSKFFIFFVAGMMEALSEELRGASAAGGVKSNIQFTTIFPYMVDTGLCKNPKIR